MARKQLYRLVGEELREFTEEEYKAHAENKKAVAKAWRAMWLTTPKGIACTDRQNERRRNKRKAEKEAAKVT